MKNSKLLLLVFVSAALVLAGCGKQPASSESAEGEPVVNERSLNRDGEVMRITIASHFSNVPAWAPVQRGVDDAAEILGINVNVVGPTDFSVAKQVSLIEGAIAAGVDAIGTTMPDSEAFNDVTREAMSRGIPVLALNADAPASGRLAYIGQSNYSAGYEVGKRLTELMSGGKVLIGIHSLDAANLVERVDGIRDALDDAGGFSYDVVATTKDLVQAATLVGSWYQANQDAVAMLAVEEVSGIAITQLLERENLGDKIVAGGFDLVPELLEGIKTGTFDYTIDQQLYMQGFYSVMQLYHAVKYGLVPASMDSGMAIIDASGIDAVIDLAAAGYR
jgi:simple sugar transport system substrate-binding protein